MQSLVAGCTLVCGLQEGTLIVDASCTGGTVVAAGVGLLENNSALSVNTQGLVNADSAWQALAASNNDSGTMGEKLNDAGSASNPWTEVIESGLTAEQLMRLIAAYIAGKTEITDLGGGNATVVFRNVSDTKNAITGTMAGSERTNVVRDP